MKHKQGSFIHRPGPGLRHYLVVAYRKARAATRPICVKSPFLPPLSGSCPH
ncbi:hypothetical protein RHECNPAF_470071 [Rhizobium etli CNPAF512]|nr:hypothetical protein RHECNPAF_470071 [Rhizobium etli CNPAF512]